MRWAGCFYVGRRQDDHAMLEVFRSQDRPTRAAFPRYVTCVGPYDTLRGAHWFIAHPNTPLRTIREHEAAAKAAHPGGRRPRTLVHFIADFWRKVDRRGADDCWPWLGSIGKWNGYPMARSVDGRVTTAGQVLLVDVLGLEECRGLYACHTCDSPPCLNPAHIWPGTQSQNMLDCSRKGRLHGFQRQC